MPTSAMTVRTNGNDFSRYYDAVRTITAYVRTTGTSDGVTVEVSLVREDGYGTVKMKTGLVASSKVTVSFDLDKDCFDADGIYRAKDGKYHITAKALDNNFTANSETFDVGIWSLREFKDRYLKGVDLRSPNITTARSQPKVVTGVRIEDSSTGHFDGIFTLAWNFTNKTLTWDGGTAYTVDMNLSVVQAELVNAATNAYITVTVITEQLPVTDKTESIIMDYATITDESLRQMLRTASGNIAGRLDNIRVEPTTVDTEGIGSAFYDSAVFTDEYADPLSFYRQEYFGRFFTIKFTYPWILKVSRLEGFFNSSRVLTVPIDNWIVTNKMAGAVEFVPKQGASLTYTFYGVPSYQFLTAYPIVPSFWHYRLTVGLPDLKADRDRVRVREAIGRSAAIEALIVAGTMNTPGLISESTSRDGVSESRAYGEGPGGRYAQIIKAHRDFLYGEDGRSGPGSEIAEMRKRLIGLPFVLL